MLRCRSAYLYYRGASSRAPKGAPCGLTASRFAEHPCGGVARPAQASIAPKPTPVWPGRSKIPGAKRRGSIELLCGTAGRYEIPGSRRNGTLAVSSA